MKFNFRIVLFLAVTINLAACMAQQDCPQGINLQAEFGHQKKCAEQLSADRDFLRECDSFYGSRRNAVEFHLDEGWKYFYSNVLEQAMKRFNQAWLLDSTNADVYWGFGNILGMRHEFQESLNYFNRSLAINPDNAKVWLGAGTSYGQLFYQTKDIAQLEQSISCFKKSILLDSLYVDTYKQLTASYAYFVQKDSARKYLAITDRLDPNAIPAELRHAVESSAGQSMN